MRRGAANVLIRESAMFEAIGGGGLADVRERAAREAVLPVLVERHDLDRDVPRRGIALQVTEHRPPQHIRQEYIERNRGRPVFANEIERVGARGGVEHLEAVRAGKVDDHPRVARIVFHDQHDMVVVR